MGGTGERSLIWGSKNVPPFLATQKHPLYPKINERGPERINTDTNLLNEMKMIPIAVTTKIDSQQQMNGRQESGETLHGN